MPCGQPKAWTFARLEQMQQQYNEARASFRIHSMWFIVTYRDSACHDWIVFQFPKFSSYAELSLKTDQEQNLKTFEPLQFLCRFSSAWMIGSKIVCGKRMKPSRTCSLAAIWGQSHPEIRGLYAFTLIDIEY